MITSKENGRSESSHARMDRKKCIERANKIIAVLNDFSKPKKSSLLDIGTGSGYITERFSTKFKTVSSVDIVDERLTKKRYKFSIVKSEKLPFKNESFDIVVSNHVIEHVADQKKHLSEISRVLRKEGIAYLASPNKYWPLDPHYRVLFIPWMPRIIAKKYLYLIKKKDWDIHPITYRKIKKLAGKNFEVDNFTPSIIKNPSKYQLDIFKSIQPITSMLPLWLLKIFSFAMPTNIVILKKKRYEVY